MLDQLIADSRNALAEGHVEKAIREIVTRTVSDTQTLLRWLGEPRRAEIQKLHQSPDLTILNVIWGPRMTINPHDHRMWAVIGVYGGREDNVFWRRIKDGRNGKLEAAGARALSTKDVVTLGPDIVHSVTNPIPRLTGALHVYGGDFFSASRSEWDPETLLEQPYSVEKALRLFDDANRGNAAR